MIPGEIVTADGDIVLNEGRATIAIAVSNTGDRPVQVGSHYHFAEFGFNGAVNGALEG